MSSSLLVHALLCGCCAVDASLDQTPSKPHIACNLTVYRRRRSTNSGRCAPSCHGSAAGSIGWQRCRSCKCSTCRFCRFIDVPGVWHAQVGQDRTIAHLFDGRRGLFFVDLAANEPVKHSNSRTLERDLGWRGLCIEGNAVLVAKLAAKRQCKVVRGIVTDKAGQNVSFEISQDLGFSHVQATGEEHGRVSSGIVAGAVERATTTTLLSILRKNRAPPIIDYLSLDLEGFEAAALHKKFPFSDYTFRSITVERPNAALQKVLRTNHYHFVVCHGWFGDQLWVHSTMVGETQRAMGILPTLPTGDVSCAPSCSRQTGPGASGMLSVATLTSFRWPAQKTGEVCGTVLLNGHQTTEDSVAPLNNSRVAW